MIVVDTNILAYLYLPGEFTEAAESLLESDPDWAAPVCGAANSAISSPVMCDGAASVSIRC